MEIWDGGVSLLLLLPLHKVYKHVVRWVIVVGVIGSTLSPENEGGGSMEHRTGGEGKVTGRERDSGQWTGL